MFLLYQKAMRRQWHDVNSQCAQVGEPAPTLPKAEARQMGKVLVTFLPKYFSGSFRGWVELANLAAHPPAPGGTTPGRAGLDAMSFQYIRISYHFQTRSLHQ